MIRAKRPRVLPLRVRDTVSVTDRNPAPFAGRNGRPLVSFLEPRNDVRCLRPMSLARLVVVRQRDVKRILSRSERGRNVAAPIAFVGIVESAVVLRPIFVPRTGLVRHGIVRRRLLPNPEDRRDDLLLPRILISDRSHRK